MTDHMISIDDASDDLLSAAAYIAESIKSSEGHASAMTAVVPRYLALGNVDLAAELANSVDDPFTRDKLLAYVAEKCAEINDDEYGLQLADAIEDHGVKAEALERIALQQSNRGDVDKALEIAGDLEHPDYVYAGIAVKRSADADDQAAAEALELIEFPPARVFALQTMAAAKAEAGDNESATVLLEQGAAAAADIDHVEEKIRILADIGNSFVDAGRNDKAVAALEAARAAAEDLDNIHRDAFLAIVALGLLHAGNLELADSTLDLVTDKTQIASALLGFSRELWKKDERSEALDALEEANAVLRSQKEIETRSAKSRYELFSTIAAQFAGFEKGERAIEVAHEIDEETTQTSALSQIAQVLTIRRQDELARQALNGINDDSPRTFALIAMSDAAMKNDDKDRAVSLLDEAAALAETVPQLPSRSSAYNEIAKRYDELGRDDKFRGASRLGLETVSQIRDESVRAISLAEMADIIGSRTLGEDERRLVSDIVGRAA